MKMLSLLGLVLMVAGVVGLLAVHSLFSPSPVVIAIQAVAVLLMIWARVTLGWRSFHATANPTQGDLVTRGPYRLIRHPIYTAVVLFVFAGAAAHLSLIVAGLALAALAGSLMRMFMEERFLRSRYPEYDAYAARTRRMVPFVF
jgi:protein-S-isoprenylcysteine O-methyltransferase Ste14